MKRNKKRSPREAVRLFVEEGIQDRTELCRLTGYSESHLYRVLGAAGARKEYDRRLDKARTLFHEMHVREDDILSALCGLSVEVIRREVLDRPGVDATGSGEHFEPNLKTAGELLRIAGEHMLRDAAENGLTDENVKAWMTLANAYEAFRTGEYRLEMILAGIAEFGAYVRSRAKEVYATDKHIALLLKLLDEYRIETMRQLREQTETIPDPE